MFENEIYWYDGISTYARDDRGPLRVLFIESGQRVSTNLAAENVRDSELRLLYLRHRAQMAGHKIS